MKGCDHSTGGAIIGDDLAANGYVGVLRYACAGRGDVNITAAEIRDLQAHGIHIGIVVEHAATWMLGGYFAGRTGAIGSQQIARACGLPNGVVYLAADDECIQQSVHNLQLVGDALRGAGDAIGRGNVGLYGSYAVIDYIASHYPWVKYFWQTAAWSYGRHHPRACVYQYASCVHIGGVECDVDDLIAADWGQRGYTPPPPPPEDTVAITGYQSWLPGQTHPVAGLAVELADGTVKHIEQQAPGSDWWKKDDGTFNWLGVGNPSK